MKYIITLFNAVIGNSKEVKPSKVVTDAKQTKFKVTLPPERPSDFNEWSKHLYSLRK